MWHDLALEVDEAAQFDSRSFSIGRLLTGDEAGVVQFDQSITVAERPMNVSLSLAAKSALQAWFRFALPIGNVPTLTATAASQRTRF